MARKLPGGWAKSSRHARGYGAEWERLRRARLERDEFCCVACRKEGRDVPATIVDHIIPLARWPKGKPVTIEDVQSLCRSHHDRKTAEENGRAYRPKVQIGLDGFPVGD